MAQVIGRLAKDAIVKTTESGKQLVEFIVVENYRYKTKTGEKRDSATFYNCALWNRIKIAPFLQKGTVISIDGKVTGNAFIHPATGTAKATLKFTVRQLEFMPTTVKSVTQPDAGKPGTGNIKDNAPKEPTDDLPF